MDISPNPELTATVKITQEVQSLRCAAQTGSGAQCHRTAQWAGYNSGHYIVFGERVWLCEQHGKIAKRERHLRDQ